MTVCVAVAVGVPELDVVPLRVRVDVPLGVILWLGDPVPVPAWLGVAEGVSPDVTVTVGLRVAVAVRVPVDDRV